MSSIRRTIPLSLFAIATFIGCSDKPIVKEIPDPPEPPPPPPDVFRVVQPAPIDKIDLLLAIDNSRSMADKQQILELAIADLVRSLINPRCIDANGMAAPAFEQPNYPTDPCPAGTNREFEPVLDIHIGVVSSSIGGHGADSCPNSESPSKECNPAPNLTNNDKGHLIDRAGPSGACGGISVPTFQDKKFLAWDPNNKYGGETIIDDGVNGGIVPKVREMVLGTGQIGCKYESQLESIYRFLADPNPYETITVENFKAIPSGTDQVLLDQRRDFLRPDSLLAVIMLTDENDCSIKEFGQFYYIGQAFNGATPVRLPRARQECATNPNDPCCKSCGQSPGSCPEDPTCKDPNGSTGPALLTQTEDNLELRCWDQKRRFGIDFLYPTDRYVQAFTSATIPDRDGNLVNNPIFSDLDPTDANSNIRNPGLVFFAGIVGVPWQDIARDKLDLKKGFKDANEMLAPLDANGLNTWDIILGDPPNGVKPKDPLMIETFERRTGNNPITGDPLVDATMPNANPINGHEWTITNDNLQYACIFPLLPGTERDCTNPNLTNCDCTEPNNDKPLCAPDPFNMNAPTLQVRAKAYPSLRPLRVLRDLGSQGIVASICPAQLTSNSAIDTDFGYRPAMGGIVDRLKTTFAGQCLADTLIPDADGNAPCVVVEARSSEGQGCTCNANEARQDIDPSSTKYSVVKVIQGLPEAQAAGWDCYCEVAQTTGDERTACQYDPATSPVLNGQPVNGWCYLDANNGIGNPELVALCPENQKRLIRFVGAGKTKAGAALFTSCSSDSGG